MVVLWCAELCGHSGLVTDLVWQDAHIRDPHPKLNSDDCSWILSCGKVSAKPNPLKHHRCIFVFEGLAVPLPRQRSASVLATAGRKMRETYAVTWLELTRDGRVRMDLCSASTFRMRICPSSTRPTPASRGYHQIPIAIVCIIW
jgi:hypothetical protein